MNYVCDLKQDSNSVIGPAPNSHHALRNVAALVYADACSAYLALSVLLQMSPLPIGQLSLSPCVLSPRLLILLHFTKKFPRVHLGGTALLPAH